MGTGGTYSLLYNLRVSAILPESAKIGTISDWIGYAGSIIGGSMTMFALVFTIQYEDKIRKRDKSYETMPSVSMKFSNDLYQVGEYFPIEPLVENKQKQKLATCVFPVTMQNISENIARSIKFEECNLFGSFLHYSEKSEQVQLDSFANEWNEHIREISILPGKQQFEFITVHKFDPSEFRYLELNIKYSYTDYLEISTHITNTIIYIQLENHGIEIFDNKEFTRYKFKFIDIKNLFIK